MITTARPTLRTLPVLVSGLVAAGLALMGQLQLSLAQGVVLADLATFSVVVWWVATSPNDPGRDLGRLLALPLLMILAGSLIAFAPNGLAEWGVRDLVLDVGAIFTFLAVYAAVSQASDLQWHRIRQALIFSLALVAFYLATSAGGGELRSAGSFPNPNLAGHFVVTVTAALAVLAVTSRQRWVLLALGTVAWAFTGSFGALLQATAMVVYHLWRRPKKATAVATVAFLMLAAGFAWLGLSSGLSSGPVTVAGVSTERLERSGEGRFEHWFDGMNALVERPWGVGPGAVKAAGYAANELHNEPLAYLVERGPLAFVGLALVAITLWRYAREKGPARTLLIGFGIASFFRETSHYRHLWLCLALMLAWEARRPSEQVPA